MTSAQKLGVAILGTGMMGEVHLRAARLAGANVLGIAGSTAASAKVAGERMRVHAYDSSSAAIADPRVDVIHVCTPNASHYGLALAALQAGKHVVCEKPLGLNAYQARTLTDVARNVGRIATVPFVYRYHPMVREARALRESGALGAIQLIHGSYLQDWLLDADATNWRVDPALGGASRAFADIGSHWCDLVEWITGERFVSVVSALSTTIEDRFSASGKTFSTMLEAEHNAQRAKVMTEDVAVALFKTANGVLANLTVSQVSAGRKNRLWFEVDGADAGITYNQEDPERLWFATKHETIMKVRDPSQGSAEQRRLATLPAGHAQGFADCFDAFVADTYATIRGQYRDGLPTFDDAVRTSEIVEAVLASHRSQSWQPIV